MSKLNCQKARPAGKKQIRIPYWKFGDIQINVCATNGGSIPSETGNRVANALRDRILSFLLQKRPSTANIEKCLKDLKTYEEQCMFCCVDQLACFGLDAPIEEAEKELFLIYPEKTRTHYCLDECQCGQNGEI